MASRLGTILSVLGVLEWNVNDPSGGLGLVWELGKLGRFGTLGWLGRLTDLEDSGDLEDLDFKAGE